METATAIETDRILDYENILPEVTERYLVPPSTPTLPSELDGQDVLVYPPTDTLALTLIMEGAWILPAVIDIKRYNDALAKALTVFRPVAGRLRKFPDTGTKKGGVYIQLTNSGIPVSVVDDYETTRVDLEHAVVPTTEEYNDLIPVTKVLEHDEPLLRIRFTRLHKTGQMVYCMAWLHALGDGYTGNLFMTYITYYYRGVDTSSLPRPSYKKIFLPFPPTDSVSRDKFLPLMKYIRDAKPMEELAAAIMESQKRTHPLNLYFSPKHIETLFKKAIAGSPDPSKAKFSKIDVLVAYLVFVYNAVLAEVNPDAEAIDTVVNTLGYRGNPALAPTAMFGNASIKFTSPSFTAPPCPGENAGPKEREQYFSRSLASIAQSIRAGAVQARTPAFLEQYLIFHNDLCRKCYQDDLYQNFLPAPREFTFNSLHRMDWRRAGDFFEAGSKYADARMTTFHTNAIWERYVRIFPPNPTRGYKDDEGNAREWDWTYDGGAEAAFRLDKSLCYLYEAKVKHDMEDGFGSSFAKL
ncbi:hypothetical protein BD410DRAFT_898794 [Rickenella mellea]|uniref:Transferase n=1 Tax=Rickenella mellea TaxID=50990 RepID=A0A4Y7Q3D1_9AGAM|nr:hypothetical protein BD410DRAFT_898794 [Rickenella mellea]